MARGAFPGLRRLRDDAGTSLIEMAFVLPVFFLMMFGFINFALMMFGMGNLTFADRAAIRYASMHSATSQVPATAASVNSIANAYTYRYPSNVTATTLTYGGSGNVVGGTVTVTIQATYTLKIPYFRSTLMPVLSTTGTATIIQ